MKSKQKPQDLFCYEYIQARLPFLTQEEVNGLLFQRKHTTIKALQAHQMQMLYFVVVSIPIVHGLVNRVDPLGLTLSQGRYWSKISQVHMRPGARRPCQKGYSQACVLLDVESDAELTSLCLKRY